MLKSMLDIKKMPKQLDASDGLAAAVCHYFQKNAGMGNKSYNNWNSYIKKNPNKII